MLNENLLLHARAGAREVLVAIPQETEHLGIVVRGSGLSRLPGWTRVK